MAESMEFTRMAFTPKPEGLRNVDAYPATPASEDEAREQIQGLLDQLRNAVNKLMEQLENAETGKSGADRIGSAAIPALSDEGEYPTTVHRQIALLSEKFQDAVSGEISISDAIGPKEIMGEMIADDALDSQHYAEGSIDSAHLANGCVTRDKIASVAVDSDHYVPGSIDHNHLADGAVTELKVGSDAVTETKIKNGAVTADKIDANAVITAKIKDGAVTVDKIVDGAVARSKIADGAVSAAKITTLEYLKMGDQKPLKFNSDNDYVFYDPGAKKLMLKLNGCEAVQLAPVIVSTQAAPDTGTYPAGTLHVQVQE